MGIRAYTAAASFIARATHVSGTLAPGGPAQRLLQVVFADEHGQLLTFSPATTPAGLSAGPVPVAYARDRDGRLDARLDIPSLLWAKWHDWLGRFLFFAFAAIFGKAAVTNPGSIIAFKSWRRSAAD